jgi:type IV secretory pathway TrbD component
MAKWGWREHKFEGYTNTMLIIGSLASIAYFYFKFDWLITFILVWMIATTIVHLIARTFHKLEKFFYKGALRH